MALALDVGGTKLAAGLVDHTGAVLVRHQVSTDGSGAEGLWGTVAALVDGVLAGAPEGVTVDTAPPGPCGEAGVELVCAAAVPTHATPRVMRPDATMREVERGMGILQGWLPWAGYRCPADTGRSRALHYERCRSVIPAGNPTQEPP